MEEPISNNQELSKVLDKQVISKPKRNKKGQLLPGNTANPNGRPIGKTLKEYARAYFEILSEEEKIKYIMNLEEKKPGFAWQMAEGNPAQDLTSGGEKINPMPIYGGQSTKDIQISEHDSDQKDLPAQEENPSS